MESLHEWALHEANFQIIATETIHGLGNIMPSVVSNSTGTGVDSGRAECRLCPGQHHISVCDDFMVMSVSQQWDIARAQRLCFRCLGDDHVGQSCQQTNVCGVHGCQLRHHLLLHRNTLES